MRFDLCSRTPTVEERERVFLTQMTQLLDFGSSYLLEFAQMVHNPLLMLSP